MIVIQAREFNFQAQKNINTSERVYRQKIFIPGAIFDSSRKEAAYRYCLFWKSYNLSLLCLLVEDGRSLQVWHERPISSSLPSKQKDSTKKQKRSPLIEAKYLLVDKVFIAQCAEILTDSIGPIAKIILNEVTSQNTGCNRERFIQKLVAKVPENRQHDLKQQLEKWASRY